ncbi:MAG: cation-translocating P-type ATPase [Burkholderiales bacterium]
MDNKTILPELNDAATDPAKGLSAAQASAHFLRDGPNELPSSKPRNAFRIALEVVREPMFLLLIAAATIYFLLGDVREALVLLVSVLVMLGITFFQERKTERALEALRDLSSPRALVIRDGEAQRIAGREVVHGDIMLLKEGDRVPADAVLLSCNDFKTDESLLTGESVPVAKIAGNPSLSPQRPGGDELPFVYSGSLAVQGHATAQVIATGLNTEMGKIGKALQTLVREASPMQQETRRAVLIFAIIGLTLCAVVVVAYGITRQDWIGGLLAGITLAMANLPEEFPVVLTVFLALGAWRISKQQVLTRRIPAIETLGSTTVLCVDKTGTITQNRMAVRELFANDENHVVEPMAQPILPGKFHELVEYSILASEDDPFDPMEKAFHALGNLHLHDYTLKREQRELVHEYPLSTQLLARTQVWRKKDNKKNELYIVACKGAPEAIADLCHFDSRQVTQMEAEVKRMASDGLRVLAVAKASLPVNVEGHSWTKTPHDFDFTFLGLIGLADPIRPSVPPALKQCYQAGIRTVMITGDYPTTAQAIARQIGLQPNDQTLTGAELQQMSDAELQARIGSVNIFARIMPEQKLRLVQAFKTAGEIVAMTGDGVNDAPALKAAHIGVAMGERGTDVAREAASLVLLHDDFASIVHAVKLGRRIFDNIQKAMCYIIAVHVPTAGMALVPLLFGWPLVFYPVHIVFLEFIIDPACSIVFEAEPAGKNVMQRPPRKPEDHLLNASVVLTSLLQGAGVLAAVWLLYWGVLQTGVSDELARTYAFATIVFSNIGMILTNLARHERFLIVLREPNPALWWIMAGTLAALAVVIYAPPVRELFRFASLPALGVALCFASAVAGLLWLELARRFNPFTKEAVKRKSG